MAGLVMAVQTEKITTERLDKWAKKLSEDHATPLLLVACGHDHTIGRIVICVPDEDEMNVTTIRALLYGALAELSRRM
jgi:hypothetical protein